MNLNCHCHASHEYTELHGKRERHQSTSISSPVLESWFTNIWTLLAIHWIRTKSLAVPISQVPFLLSPAKVTFHFLALFSIQPLNLAQAWGCCLCGGEGVRACMMFWGKSTKFIHMTVQITIPMLNLKLDVNFGGSFTCIFISTQVFDRIHC